MASAYDAKLVDFASLQCKPAIWSSAILPCRIVGRNNDYQGRVGLAKAGV